MHCRDCARYIGGRCVDGKVNPQSWSMAVEVANVMGIRSICAFNDHRQKLVDSRGRRDTQVQGKRKKT